MGLIRLTANWSNSGLNQPTFYKFRLDNVPPERRLCLESITEIYSPIIWFAAKEVSRKFRKKPLVLNKKMVHRTNFENLLWVRYCGVCEVNYPQINYPIQNESNLKFIKSIYKKWIKFNWII